MKYSMVAKRYASALFEASLGQDKLGLVEADLNLLEKEYQDLANFKQLIDSPVIPNEVKKGAFNSIFMTRLDGLTFSFLNLLIDKNRESLLLQIIEFFRELADEHRGILRAEVFSMVPLTEDQMAELKLKLDAQTGKNVVLSQRIDKSLLGGLVVRIKDRIIDASLKNQLNKLREVLIGS